MNWDTEKVVNDLPKIRRLKGVAKAYTNGQYLRVRTNGLRHPNQWLGLADIEITIPLGNGRSAMRYLNPWSHVWNSHPTIGMGIGKYSYKVFCTGDNEYDYEGSRSFGPYMTVLQQLAMLQTIQRDKTDSRYYKTIEDKILAILPVVAVVTVVAFFVFLITSIH